MYLSVFNNVLYLDLVFMSLCPKVGQALLNNAVLAAEVHLCYTRISFDMFLPRVKVYL